MDSLAKLLFAILFAFFMYSCGRTEVSKRLTDIESYINERPDSALSDLRQVDTLSLRTKAEKAKYSLLHAMALDKNYIDTADTRIIMPAVEYYGRHGSPEDRLKSLMYLGVEQYNAGLYNQAIVSFYQASEYAPKIEDQNLLGILYSRMADTYTMTRDYVQAEEYIDRSIESFKFDGNKDYEYLELARKARNLAQQKQWTDAATLYDSLLNDSLTSNLIKAEIELDYALCLLYSPSEEDTTVYHLMNDAIIGKVKFKNEDQIGALAYIRHKFGELDLADSLFLLIEGHNKEHYRKHRIELDKKDFKKAYNELLLSSQNTDSLLNSISVFSAANAQRTFLEQLKEDNSQRIKNQRLWLAIIALFCTLLLSVSYSLLLAYRSKKQEQEEEMERMRMLTEILNNQILNQKKENEKLSRDTNKAKFAFMAEVYETAYRLVGDKENAEDKILHVLASKVGDLRSNKESQQYFETMIDAEMGGLMSKFRRDCPYLKESEYKMASYYFAGFDNTTVMIIMGISSLENTRMRKSRLRQKIVKIESSQRDVFLQYL